MARLLRQKAKADQVNMLTARLMQLDRDLMAVCCQPDNPLSLGAADDLARLHRKMRSLRHRIEIEAGRW